MPVNSQKKTKASKAKKAKVTKVTKTKTTSKKASKMTGGAKTKVKAKVAKKQVQKAPAKSVTAKVKKSQRSFKVKLPNSEVYEGRFTGLTPYQAANKALSKFYRENKKAKTKIRFSIKESTRGSKRLVYFYNGHREKLSKPVEYVIKNGDESRKITKNYKNKLTKIKKAELKGLNLA